MQQAMWDERKPDLRDRCGWCIFGKHERCQRTYAYEKHVVLCTCAENLSLRGHRLP